MENQRFPCPGACGAGRPGGDLWVGWGASHFRRDGVPGPELNNSPHRELLTKRCYEIYFTDFSAGRESRKEFPMMIKDRQLYKTWKPLVKPMFPRLEGRLGAMPTSRQRGVEGAHGRAAQCGTSAARRCRRARRPRAGLASVPEHGARGPGRPCSSLRPRRADPRGACITL